jgi:hypothetical protein
VFLGLLRTALGGRTSSVDGDTVQRRLRAVVGLASSERERVEVVVRFFLLTVDKKVLLVLPFTSEVSPVVSTYGSFHAM